MPGCLSCDPFCAPVACHAPDPPADAPTLVAKRKAGKHTLGAQYGLRDETAVLSWERKPFKASGGVGMQGCLWVCCTPQQPVADALGVVTFFLGADMALEPPTAQHGLHLAVHAVSSAGAALGCGRDGAGPGLFCMLGATPAPCAPAPARPLPCW